VVAERIRQEVIGLAIPHSVSKTADVVTSASGQSRLTMVRADQQLNWLRERTNNFTKQNHAGTIVSKQL